MKFDLALPVIRTERLLLRLAEERDASKILNYLTVNRVFLRPLEPVKPPAYFTEAFWRLQIARSLQEFRADQSVRMFLFDSEGEVIGTVNLTGIARGPFQACYLGYGMAEHAQGLGYMNEALRATIDYAFGELNLHRIMANYMPHNVRSARVLKRLGFEIEGHAKDYIQIEGVWRDHVLTSLVNSN